eukprot:6126621-Amphidinium_carterae.3
MEYESETHLRVLCAKQSRPLDIIFMRVHEETSQAFPLPPCGLKQQALRFEWNTGSCEGRTCLGQAVSEQSHHYQPAGGYGGNQQRSQRRDNEQSTQAIMDTPMTIP